MAKRGTPSTGRHVSDGRRARDQHANFTANDCTIGRLGGDDVNAGRVSFRWDPTTSVRLTLNADYIRDLSENTADHVVDIDPSASATTSRASSRTSGWSWTSASIPAVRTRPM